jgi:hypothetical protein
MPNITQINGSEFGLQEARNYIPPVLPEVFDYSAIAATRLTNQFQEKPLLTALNAAMVLPLNSSESLANDVRDKRWIKTAIGLQLDKIGSVVGESRLGRSDDEYRVGILFRIFVNTSNATPRDMMQGLSLLTSPDDMQYIEQYPATAMVLTNGASIPRGIHNVMQGLAPAAISDVQVLVTFANAPPFRFSRDPIPRELFVNLDADYLVANGSDIQISGAAKTTGATLGGLAPADLSVNGFMLDVGVGTLSINDINNNVVIESGYHLLGCYA